MRAAVHPRFVPALFGTIGSVSYLISVLACSTAWGQIDQPALRRLVLEDVEQGILFLEEPRIQEPPAGGTELSYSYGPLDFDCPKCKKRHRNLHCETPLGYPILLQKTVEEFRTYRPLQFWDPYLAQVEKLVADQLAIINAQQLALPKLHESLIELQEKGFAIIDNAIVASARSRGWTARRQERAAAPQAGPPTFLRVSTVPAGAEVYHLSKSGYDRLVRYKGDRRLSEWVPSKKNGTNWTNYAGTGPGAVYVVAYWADTGRSKVVGPIEVDFPPDFNGDEYFKDLQIDAN